jgi:hypothetical protein
VSFFGCIKKNSIIECRWVACGFNLGALAAVRREHPEMVNGTATIFFVFFLFLSRGENESAQPSFLVVQYAWSFYGFVFRCGIISSFVCLVMV